MRTMNRTAIIIATLIAGTHLAAGCGGGDSQSPDVTTGIAPNKLLSDVTTDEAAQACENLQAGFEARLSRDALVRSICTIFGAAFADTPAACADARDTCIEQADDPTAVANGDAPDIEEIQFECDGGASLSECTSTVGELEACFNDLLDQISTALSSITCDDAASLEMDDVDAFRESTFEPPASCEVVDCGEDSPFGMNDEDSQ
jgi:hypothetical protein